ncbi:MAG: hypothetical protein ACREPK_01235 [Rhodanobacteraceae bacterium]
MKSSWLYVLPCILLSIGSIAIAAPPTVPLPPTHNPLLKPLEHGDSSAVHQVENKYGAGPVTRAMDRAQLGYDMPRLLSAARRCQDLGIQGGTADDLGTALYCSYLARSSALIEGNALAYLQEVQWVKNTLYPAMERAINDHPIFGTGLDPANLRRLTDATPAVAETWLSGSQALSFQASGRTRGSTDAQPKIGIKINGQNIAAFIEMGRGTLRTPITIIEPKEERASISSKLKLKLVVQDYANAFVRFGGAKYTITPSLYIADNVSVGPLMLHHVAVGVVTADFIRPGVYLGASMWRRFGEVMISGAGIRLSRQATHQCEPVVPMTFAANYHEVGSLQFPISVNGVTRTAALSIRATDLVDMGSSTWVDPGARAASAGTRKDRTVKDPITIQVGHQSFNTPSAYVATNWHEPFQVSLGRSILDRYIVHLKLRGGNPSICFAPNPGENGGRAH